MTQKRPAHAILLGKKLDLLPKRCSFMATWPWRLVGLVLVAMSAPVMSASVLNCGPVRVHQCLVTTISKLLTIVLSCGKKLNVI